MEGEDLEENLLQSQKKKITLVKINPKFFRPAEVELCLVIAHLLKKN